MSKSAPNECHARMHAYSRSSTVAYLPNMSACKCIDSGDTLRDQGQLLVFTESKDEAYISGASEP